MLLQHGGKESNFGIICKNGKPSGKKNLEVNEFEKDEKSTNKIFGGPKSIFQTSLSIFPVLEVVEEEMKGRGSFIE